MTVYVVECGDDSELGIVLGVFSTREKAEAFLARWKHRIGYSHRGILEFVMDEPEVWDTE